MNPPGLGAGVYAGGLMDFSEMHNPRVVVFPFYNSDVVKDGPFHKRSDIYTRTRPRRIQPVRAKSPAIGHGDDRIRGGRDATEEAES